MSHNKKTHWWNIGDSYLFARLTDDGGLRLKSGPGGEPIEITRDTFENLVYFAVGIEGIDLWKTRWKPELPAEEG